MTAHLSSLISAKKPSFRLDTRYYISRLQSQLISSSSLLAAGSYIKCLYVLHLVLKKSAVSRIISTLHRNS